MSENIFLIIRVRGFREEEGGVNSEVRPELNYPTPNCMIRLWRSRLVERTKHNQVNYSRDPKEHQQILTDP